MDRNNLLLRVLTALVLAPLLLALVLLGSTPLFALVLALVFAVGAHEWAPLAGWSPASRRWGFAMLVLAGLAGVWLSGREGVVLTGLLCVALVWWSLALAWVMRRWPLGPWSKLVAGLCTLVPAWTALVVLHAAPQGPWLVLALLFIVWGADVGAYFAGHAWGRHKLAPEVSPGKTWEGVVGGLVLAAVVAWVAADLLAFPAPQFMLLALVVMLASVVGDLMESLLKRQAGVKDSSRLLPGHGGVLDRLDSLHAAAPTFLAGLLLLGLLR